MGLFSKSKKVNEYEEASNNLNNEATTLASERVIFEQIQDDDERAAFLVDQMKLGSPLIINFEKLPIMVVNKLLAFFAGACYAVDGNTVKINDYTYCFARKEEFSDGSLNELLHQI